MSEHESLKPLSREQRLRLERATASYEEALEHHERAQAYLLGRGMPLAVARMYRLGVVENPEPEHAMHQGMLAIPYLVKDDRVVSIRFRCLFDKEHDCKSMGHGKYMTVSGEPGRMYNVRAIFGADQEMSICEGEMDAITLNMCGVPAVGVPGASAWKSHYNDLLAGFSTIWLWGDPDKAGMEFNQRVQKALPNARMVQLDMDVNDTYKAEGPDGIWSRMRED